MPYLTPDDPPPTNFQVSVDIPDHPNWLAVFFGALSELSNPENWEQFGDLTPDEISQIWDDIIQSVVVT